MRSLLGETRRESELAGVRRWMHARERRLVVAWLVGWTALFAVLFVWGVWRRGFEDVVAWWYGRSAHELARAEQLHESGEFARSAEVLERVDASHPAVQVKHRLDQEREAILALLAKDYVALDKKRRALETTEKLVAFDPRNWQNHYARAEALRAFAESDLAEAAYREVLRLHPNHFPTVETLTGMLFDVATLYQKVVELHRQYLDAWLLGSVDVTIGDAHVTLDVPVDGRPHAFDVPFALPDGAHGEVRVATHGFSVRIGALELVPALRVGELASAERARVDGGWIPHDAKALENGRFSAETPASSFTRSVDAPRGAGRLRIELSLYKRMTSGLWEKVRTSYRNRLYFDELAAAEERTVIGGCLEAGSLFEE
jgi:tetratricopeptide (TPR) repeat protein